VGVVCGFFTVGTLVVVAVGLRLAGISLNTVGRTSLVVVLYISLNSSIVYAIKGMVFVYFSLISGILVLIAVLAVRFTLYDKMVREHKLYIFLIVLAVLTIIAIPLNIIDLSPHYAKANKEGKLFVWGSVCKPKKFT